MLLSAPMESDTRPSHARRKRCDTRLSWDAASIRGYTRKLLFDCLYLFKSHRGTIPKIQGFYGAIVRTVAHYSVVQRN